MSSNDSGYQPQITGTFTAVSQVVDLTSPNGATEVVQVVGTWVGTILIEGSNDETNYYLIQSIDRSTGLLISSITTNGTYESKTNGFKYLRLRSSAWTSGTATISVSGSDASSINSNIDLLRGATDGTLIGNTGDRLKVDANVIISGNVDKSAFTYGTSTEQPIGAVYQDTSPSLTAGTQGALRSTSQRALHTNLRDSSGKEIGAVGNPVLTGFNPGTSSIFGEIITGKRINQFDVDFSKGNVGGKLNIRNTGSGTEAIANGQASFSTGTSTTASSQGSTFYSIKYAPGHEIYAEFTAAFTAPTSAASFQRIGLFDANNGFFLGYNGLNFGIGRRSNVSDTHTLKASFSEDTLTGAAG